MDRALELGINFFDTADVYGWKQGEGVTEQIIGRWFGPGGDRRERVVLADQGLRKRWSHTTVLILIAARAFRAQNHPRVRRQPAPAANDYIDLYQMHHIDRSCPFDEIWQAMETLIARGKILHVGSSNFAGWDIATAQHTAASRHFVGLISEQSVYSLENRMVELEVLPPAGITAWA